MKENSGVFCVVSQIATSEHADVTVRIGFEFENSFVNSSAVYGVRP